MAWDGIERRKSYCPICKDRRAKPITVTEGGRMRVVELECEQCGFKWQLEQSLPGER